MDAMQTLNPPEPLEEIISVIHTKGGAGKSSLTTNMAYSLSCLGYRVLVIDLDRQTGQSVGFGLGSVIRHNTNLQGADIGAVLRGEVGLTDAIIWGIYPNLDFVPAEESSLIRAENELAALGIDGKVRLYEILHACETRWDVVLIDTPGRKTDILEVALAASTGVLIPAIPEGGPVSELTSVLSQVERAKAAYGSVEVYGVIRMRVGGNSRYRRLAEEQTKEVADSFGIPVFKNKVPEDAKFGEAHLAREPIGVYSPSARSAVAFRFLADELAARRSWPDRIISGEGGASGEASVAPIRGSLSSALDPVEELIPNPAHEIALGSGSGCASGGIENATTSPAEEQPQVLAPLKSPLLAPLAASHGALHPGI